MKKILSAVMALMLMLSMVACGSTSKEESEKETENAAAAVSSEKTEVGEEIELEVWLCSYATEEELKLSQDQWEITKVLEDFEKANPGVSVEMVMQSDQRTVHQTLKAAAIGGTAPDVVNLWSGSQLFALKDVLMGLDDYVTEDELKNITGWENVRNEFEADGEILGYPVRSVDVASLMYNKDVLKEAGLDYDTNPPQTVDQFLADLETIKNAGYVPIECNDINSVGGIISSTFGVWWAQASGLDRIYANSTGAESFADDQGFIDVFSTVNEMYNKGYLNEDYLTSVTGTDKFLTGQAAMLADGNWSVGSVKDVLGDSFGILKLPQFTEEPKSEGLVLGGAGQAMCVSADTKYPEMARKLASYLASKEVALRLYKNGQIPVRTDVTFEELDLEGDVYNTIYELSSKTSFWLDNAMSAGMVDEYSRVQQELVVGNISVEEGAEQLDNKVKELANN